MKKNFLSVLLIFTTVFAFAQTPCNNGEAGGYECNGYDLMAHIPLSVFNTTGANDSWGWTDPDDGKEYVLMGLENGTAFIDISDPVNPIYLGKLPTATGTTVWRDIKTYNNYAFIVSEASGHGMQIFDLTHLRNVNNPPVTFTEDAHYSGFSDAHNIVINENTGYAYAVGTNTFGGGAHFVNIQDPLNPVAAGGFSADGNTHDAQVVTYIGPDADYAGSEIYIGSNGSGQIISIVDVTNKSNPQGISTLSYSNSGYTHQGWFTEDHRFFLLGDEFDESNVGFNTRTIVFDLTDLDNPVLSYEYFGVTPAIDHNGYVKGDNYYLSNYAAGLRVLDISDIENDNIVEIGFFDTYQDNNDASYNGVWNVYPYFESENIMINDRSGGFFLVRSSLLNNNDFSAVNTFVVYPNPASDELTIKSNGDVISSISIVDVVGKVLFAESDLNSEIKNIDISSFSAGIYFVNINNNLTKKVIKK
ncbi:MAG: choice-of-anchor B family protein [Bacteroidetes bacterium]|nr:MAG: choice-of-anchor B family protein [Bacteroidota bacterium]